MTEPRSIPPDRYEQLRHEAYTEAAKVESDPYLQVGDIVEYLIDEIKKLDLAILRLMGVNNQQRWDLEKK